jgi:hypothetical protein
MTDHENGPFAYPPPEWRPPPAPGSSGAGAWGMPPGAYGPPLDPSAPPGRRPGSGARRAVLVVVGVVAAMALIAAVEWVVIDHVHPTRTVVHTIVRPTGTPSTTIDRQHLLSILVPQPPGFSTEDDTNDGPVDDVAFDVYLSDRTASSDLDYIDGYDQTYNSNETDDSEEFAVFEFQSADDASMFKDEYLSAFDFKGTSDPTMPNVSDYDQPGQDPSQPTDHGVVGVKGTRAFVVDVYSDAGQPRPPVLATLAQEQLERL